MIRKRQNEGLRRRFKIVMRGCRPGTRPGGPRRQKAEGSRQPALTHLVIAALLLLSAFCFPLSVFAQAKTTVSDTIHGPDGSLPSGKIVLRSKSTFTAADGTVVFSGSVATATVTNGTFSVSLIPNAGSTPSGTSYSAIYMLAGVPYREETWVVPASATPVDLSAVRSATLSGPSGSVTASQMPALTGDATSTAGSVETSVVGVHFGSTALSLGTAPSDGQCLTRSGLTIAGGSCGSGGVVFNVKTYGAVGNGATDDTTAVNAAFAAAYAAGGGVIYFPPGTYLIAGALTIPNDGAAQPKQPPYRIEGAAMDANASGWGGNPANGSILLMTETSDTQGKIDTRGGGYLEIDHLSFYDTAADSVPFIFTTNTILHVHDCSFTSSQTGTANVQDALILGGFDPAKIHSGDSDAPFQGYGTVIRDNFFNRVRHAVVGNTYANGVQIVDNTVGSGSGSSTSGDAPFVFVGYGSGSESNSGAYISGNLIELHNYYYGVRLDQYADNFVMLGNNAYDQGSNTVATYYLGTGSTTEIMSCGQVAVSCVDTSSPGAAQNAYVAFTTSVDANGNGSYIGNKPMFPKGLTVRSGENLALQTIPGQETHIYEQSYNTYIQPNDGASYRSIITHNGQWGILNTSPQAAFDVNGAIRTRPVAFASAPACSSGNEGSMQAINDSSTATWGATITGGGANHVLGYCDGTVWTVAGK